MDEDEAYDSDEYHLIPDPRTILRLGCDIKLENEFLFRSVVVSVNYFLNEDFTQLLKMGGKNRARQAALFRQGQENLVRFIRLNDDTDEVLERTLQGWVFAQQLRIRPRCKSAYLQGVIESLPVEVTSEWKRVTLAYLYRTMKG
jgi:hypothetical protein